MNLISISINHHTAPVELREALHLTVEEIKELLTVLKGNIFSEGLILSTCNRTEIYGLPISPQTGYKDIQKFLIERKEADSLSSSNFQNFFSCGAVSHLFKVAAGIDSLMIGDNQILGQVKEAFQISEDLGFSGFLLKRIFDSTLKVGKRTKSETVISDGATTVSYAAVQLIQKIFSLLNKKSALVIGAGETGELAAKHLYDKGIGNITITNRTISRAEQLAKKTRAKVVSFEKFKDSLANYDIIISATSSKDILLGFNDIASAMKQRNNAPMVIADIAVPRDISSDVKTIENVFYHDIDSLNIIIDQNVKKRQSEIPKVEKIILEELVNFFGWYNSLEVTPTIVSLRQVFEKIRTEEFDKVKNKFTAEDIEKVEIVTKRIINRLLHQPTTELKKLAENNIDTNESKAIIDAVRSIFGLDEND